MEGTKPVDQFKALTTLLHLAQVVNSVNDKSAENIRRKCCSGYFDNISDFTTQDAIASILVQRHDVDIVAASFQDLDKVSVVVATTNPKISEFYPDSEVSWLILTRFVGSPSQLASDSEPDQVPGKGVWKQVRNSPWYCAFK